jgi:hypothetical protein
MGQLNEAKAIREEAYMYVNETYDSEHPLVLEAGGELIEILNRTGNYYDAERFARVCYEALTRAPLDPNSYEAADAARNLANASCNLIETNGFKSAVIEEAEMLARKAVRIMKELKESKSIEMINTFQTLVNVLSTKKDFSDETKRLLEDYLNYAIRFQGLDSESASFAQRHLGRFHYNFSDTFCSNDAKTKHPQLAESYYKEELLIFIKHYGPNHFNTLQITSNLSILSTALEQIENHHSSEEP